MRSIEVEQDVLPERRNKHDGGFEKGRSQDEREHEHERRLPVLGKANVPATPLSPAFSNCCW